MPGFDYENILVSFGNTLEELSEDTSKESKEGKIYLTTSKKRVIDFDNFTHSIIENIEPRNRPRTCDVLMKLNGNMYYFIEFKNGRIREKHEACEIREKILESLLIFLEQINHTICFSRNNCYFILVYNTNTATKGMKSKGLEKIENKLDKLTHLNKYEKIFLKRTFVYSISEFETEFVKKYCV